jgi:hypothetical protein
VMPHHRRRAQRGGPRASGSGSRASGHSGTRPVEAAIKNAKAIRERRLQTSYETAIREAEDTMGHLAHRREHWLKFPQPDDVVRQYSCCEFVTVFHAGGDAFFAHYHGGECDCLDRKTAPDFWNPIKENLALLRRVVLPFRVAPDCRAKVDALLSLDASATKWSEITKKKGLEPFIPQKFGDWTQQIRARSCIVRSLVIPRLATVAIPLVLQKLVCEYLLSLPRSLSDFPELSSTWEAPLPDAID